MEDANNSRHKEACDKFRQDIINCMKDDITYNKDVENIFNRMTSGSEDLSLRYQLMRTFKNIQPNRINNLLISGSVIETEDTELNRCFYLCYRIIKFLFRNKELFEDPEKYDLLTITYVEYICSKEEINEIINIVRRAVIGFGAVIRLFCEDACSITYSVSWKKSYYTGEYPDIEKIAAMELRSEEERSLPEDIPNISQIGLYSKSDMEVARYLVKTRGDY